MTEHELRYCTLSFAMGHPGIARTYLSQMFMNLLPNSMTPKIARELLAGDYLTNNSSMSMSPYKHCELHLHERKIRAGKVQEP